MTGRKVRITVCGLHFLSAGKDKHKLRERRENKEGRGRETERNVHVGFFFLFGSNGDLFRPLG